MVESLTAEAAIVGNAADYPPHVNEIEFLTSIYDQSSSTSSTMKLQFDTWLDRAQVDPCYLRTRMLTFKASVRRYPWPSLLRTSLVREVESPDTCSSSNIEHVSWFGFNWSQIEGAVEDK